MESSEEALQAIVDNIKNELTDILIYSMLLVNDLELDVKEIVLRKL